MDDKMKALLSEVMGNVEHDAITSAGKATHDLFQAFVDGGFTEAQALRLTANIIVGAILNPKK